MANLLFFVLAAYGYTALMIILLTLYLQISHKRTYQHLQKLKKKQQQFEDHA